MVIVIVIYYYPISQSIIQNVGIEFLLNVIDLPHSAHIEYTHYSHLHAVLLRYSGPAALCAGVCRIFAIGHIHI